MKRFLLALTLFGLLTPMAVEAQRRPLPPPAWTVGVRGGIDTNLPAAELLGVVTRVPVPVLSGAAVQAAMDWTFLTAVTDWQVSVDAVYDLRGISVGGGPVFRNSLWSEEDFLVRETRTGFSVFGSVGGTPAGPFPAAIALEIRYIRVSDFTPTPLTLGVNVVPLRLFRGRDDRR